MSLPSLDQPSAAQWKRLGIDEPVEIHGGRQSRVFLAAVAGERVAVKLTDSRLVDATIVRTRSEVVEDLARRCDLAVSPIRIGGDLVNPLDDWLVTATQFVAGDEVSAAVAADAALMGSTISDLHRAMSELEAWDLPAVAALESQSPETDRSGWQLLHGDLSDKNVIAVDGGLRVFDFDECGYGPIEYDLANSIYMVLFDDSVTEPTGDRGRYRSFRSSFLQAYGERSKIEVAVGSIDAMIDLRIKALATWLDDLSTAPIGIRTASLAWQDTLRSFVESHPTSME